MFNFILLALGIFALGCDDYIYAGLLPGISASLNASIAATAQGASAFGMAYVGALPVCIYLLSRYRALQILHIALITFVAGTLCTFVATSLPVFLLGRTLAGLGEGLYLPLAIAAAAELAPPQSKGRALSLAWGANSAGAVIGIPIGLWLADAYGWRASVGMILVLGLLPLVGLMSRRLELTVETPPSLREQVSFLVDPGVMSVIGVTLLTTTAGLGLYVYTVPILEGAAVTSAPALTLWNVGGLLGSLLIGDVVDRVGNAQKVMAGVLLVFFAVFVSIPMLRMIPLVGLLPFLLWGLMGWSTMTPQQYRLSQLKPGRDATLVALNSSAASLGAVAGAALGGLAISANVDATLLPYLASVLLLLALLWQLWLIQRPSRAEGATEGAGVGSAAE